MVTTEVKLEAYRRMLRIRVFENEGTRLYKAGEIPGAFHASLGHEATIVGACLALRDEDTMTGTHRSHGHPIGKGARLDRLMAELMGKESGICKGRGGSMHLADNSVGIIGESAIVGGGIPLATGCAFSAKLRGTDQVSLCFFGDGAVNQGSFHESLNMAALWKLPVVYLCENNLYAIVTSLDRSHAQTDISARAQAYGLPGQTVDGQDVLAVYDAVLSAVERARQGDGPSLIEARTYRFDEHQVGLFVPGPPYRDPKEVEYYKSQRDPVKLFRDALLRQGTYAYQLDAIEEEIGAEVAAAVAFARASSWPDFADVANYMSEDAGARQ